MSKAQAQKAREATAGTKRKLSRAEQKQIAALIRQAKGDGKAHTAQQTIPYLQMYPDGICRITEKKYSKSVVFEDINYQLAQPDDKTAIFEALCDMYNSFDASISVQLSLEHLTKPKSDQSGSKGEKSQMDISPAFISDEQAPVSMEPGKGSLNNPAVLSKMRGTVHPTSGNAVLYMSHCARLSAKRKIVPFISAQFLRMTSGSPVQISQGRPRIQPIFQPFAIIHIGGSEADNKRNAIAIRYEMMFTSGTTSIYGVGSCVFAPLFAWMTEPSIQALLQSIFFVSCKFCRMT